jgi:hypothetical protein
MNLDGPSRRAWRYPSVFAPLSQFDFGLEIDQAVADQDRPTILGMRERLAQPVAYLGCDFVDRDPAHRRFVGRLPPRRGHASGLVDIKNEGW